MTSRRVMLATTFSRRSAPPPPLIIWKRPSISSAPSTVRSIVSTCSRDASGIPSSRALRFGVERGRHAPHGQALVADALGQALAGRRARSSPCRGPGSARWRRAPRPRRPAARFARSAIAGKRLAVRRAARPNARRPPRGERRGNPWRSGGLALVELSCWLRLSLNSDWPSRDLPRRPRTRPRGQPRPHRWRARLPPPPDGARAPARAPRVRLVRRVDVGDLLELEVRGSRLSLRRGEAGRLLVTAAGRVKLAVGRKRVALAGNPNTGKTTLFNRLTGADAKVGNYPGVTVEQRQRRAELAGRGRTELLDVPGTYSLSARSARGADRDPGHRRPAPLERPDAVAARRRRHAALAQPLPRAAGARARPAARRSRST